MDISLDKKLNRLLQLEKPNNLLTMWSIDGICNRLDAPLISDRLETTTRMDMLANLYQLLGVKVVTSISEENIAIITKGYELSKVIYYSNRIEDSGKRLLLLVQLCSSGIISGRFAEVRMILNEEHIEDIFYEIKDVHSLDYVRNALFIIFLLLARKLNGWRDIEVVEQILNDVNKNTLEIEDMNNVKVYVLGAYLYILEALEQYKGYIINGKPANIEKVIVRNIISAKKILAEYEDDMLFICTLLQEALIRQIQVSLWSTLNGVSEKIDKYVEFLTLKDNKKPIFDLWPSQKKVIKTNLFDVNKSAVIVQMPTSAGKSLLAKFYILQVLNSYTNGKIAYIVPTRALVNQVKRDLRREFNKFDIKVEIAIPCMELDDIEETVLIKDTDILVTTPEKLDIMLRAKHPFIEQLKLLVVDEAHGIQEENRGAKLELLLAMLRKQDRNLKILMLSPFMQNAKDVVKWLSGDRGLDILVDWKPSQQYTGIDKIKKGSRGNHQEIVTYIPSTLSDMYHKEFQIGIQKIKRANIGKLDRAYNLAIKYERLGGVLILCTQRRYTELLVQRFKKRECLSEDKIFKLSKLLDLIEDEMGIDSLLYQSIKRGCAYHHSAIPLIIREEIEEAISQGLITVIAATTTLAQGMNFPIATVIFQGMSIPTESIPPSRPMTTAEFWNIAGRAGRALVDKEGHIISICNEKNDEQHYREYLNRKNQEVFSSLLQVVSELPVECLSSKYIEKHKELSAFLQYVYHTLKIQSDIEIEDLLRGSFVYANLEQLGREDLGEKLLTITQNYINKIRLSGDLDRKRLMDIIDKTGLSSISMHKLMMEVNSSRGLRFDIDTIFNSDDSMLSRYIQIANSIPEINLGIYDSESQFNPQLVSDITKAWVNGDSIRSIANRYIYGDDINDRMSICGKYIYGKLINNLPWALSAILKADGIINKKNEDDVMDNTLIPSYIYFGVNNKISVILCMLGVTRYASFILAKEWKRNYEGLDEVEKIKAWLENLNLGQWREIFNKYKGRNAETNYDMWLKNR